LKFGWRRGFDQDMKTQQLLETRRGEILQIARRYGARNVRVFGSVARGDDHSYSDIDFLVELDSDRSLMDLSGLLIDLQNLLQRKIQRQQPKTDHDNKIKRIGDSLLNHVRTMMKDVADTDEVLYFKLNRWIYSRLLQDEISKKRPIKKALWDSGMRSCQKCGKQFESIKGVEIHRINNAEIYSIKNCILLCRPCHQQ
jgi:uncharacterized protein